ncbi:MAG: family 2 glycosyl transferase [Parcubacteria group bacterium Gr01-1014_91]|nr:MAG: family 2 glycosyl transferase [Parcubacteria group bacterium Gr01-1014_91]
MKDTPKVSIIVSNYNSSDLINGTLEPIMSTAGDVPFEVIVVDDVSTDGGLSLVDEKYKRDPRFTFVQCEKHVGYSALNVVLDRTRGKYLMTLDTDARLWHGALPTLVDFMENNPKAGAVTASLFYEDGSPQNYNRRLMTPMHSFFTTVLGRVIDKYFLGLRNYKSYHYDDFDNTRVFEIEQPPTACFMFRRAAIGSYIVDTDFNHVFLDVDLCRRIYDGGYKIYLVPDAKVTHFKSVAANKKPNLWRDYQYYRDQLIYFKKHYPAYAPLMAFVLWLDRVMRRVLIYTTGRAPMR